MSIFVVNCLHIFSYFDFLLRHSQKHQRHLDKFAYKKPLSEQRGDSDDGMLDPDAVVFSCCRRNDCTIGHEVNDCEEIKT